MAKELKLKPAYADVQNGFLGNWTTMGQRSDMELRKFYAQAQAHGIQSDLEMFDLEDGEKEKVPDKTPLSVPIVKVKKGRKPSKKAEIIVRTLSKPANESDNSQTPATPEQAELNHIHSEGGAPASTSATDGTAITPVA